MKSISYSQQQPDRYGDSASQTAQSADHTPSKQPLQRITSRNTSYHSFHAHQSIPPEHDLAEFRPTREDHIQGLGLTDVSIDRERIRRVPVGSKDNLRETTSPLGPKTLPAPTASPGIFSQATTAHNTPQGGLGDSERASRWTTPQASRLTLRETSFQYEAPDGSLLDHKHGEHHCEGCPTQGDVLKTRMNWFAITILLLAVYSTMFSGVFLGIAFAKPRWGHKIGTPGSLSFPGATLLSALFSKTVELSFATVFVATLGQLLSRKAFVRDSISRARGAGISIAQMNMRLWIMQPGTLITNWIGVKYALPSPIGLVALTATISTIFYTTAAEALVAPKLQMGMYEARELVGKVSASYANSAYLNQQCRTPIPNSMEPVPLARGSTCLQMTHAGQGFHNFDSWITQWAEKIRNAEVRSKDPRPPPIAILFDNTTVSGQWIRPSGENITADSQKWGRLVHNVTMVMPHANLINAAHDPTNQIIQPVDLQGAGEYYVKAAIPAPAVNILCAGLSSTELDPMIQNDATESVPTRNFTTVLDNIFGWSSEFSLTPAQFAPWFKRKPDVYNTVGNDTSTWGPSSIYILAQPDNRTIVTNDYVLCSMRSVQHPNCTTVYHVSGSGGNLTVHCDADPANVLPYSKFNPAAPIGAVENNWKDVAVEWVRAVALTHGLTSGNASIARIINQMIPSYSKDMPTRLKDNLPSPGEALGVLSGNTLLLSSLDAPFVHYWNYTTPEAVLEVPQYEHFQALVAYKDYASGGTQRFQGIFYIILFSTFVMNCWCFAYLVFHFWFLGHITDYTEPQNLFALAINSPPSHILAGACGGGPTGLMLKKKWYVDMSQQQPTPNPLQNLDDIGGSSMVATGSKHPHFYVRSTEEPALNTPQPYMSPAYGASSPWPDTPTGKSPRVRFSPLIKSPKSAISGVKDALLRSRSRIQHTADEIRARGKYSRPKSVGDFTVDESPAVDQYMRLIGKR